MVSFALAGLCAPLFGFIFRFISPRLSGSFFFLWLFGGTIGFMYKKYGAGGDKMAQPGANLKKERIKFLFFYF